MNKIVVIGSANMDYTFKVEDATIYVDKKDAEITLRSVGGKGANQAVAASRLGANVSFIGCIGDDNAGIEIKENLLKENINISGIKVIPNEKSDGRYIYIDSLGNNPMYGMGNDIKKLDVELIKNNIHLINESDIVMIQLKMPEETIKYILDYCTENNKVLCINGAPEKNTNILIKYDALSLADVININEDEAFYLYKYLQNENSIEKIAQEYLSIEYEERFKIYKELVKKYTNIIITLGEHGAMFNEMGEVKVKEAYVTNDAKDPTGCGDTFNSAYAVKLLEGSSKSNAIDFANKAASITLRYEGAQIGMPTKEKVDGIV